MITGNKFALCQEKNICAVPLTLCLFCLFRSDFLFVVIASVPVIVVMFNLHVRIMVVVHCA
jgi:hypothetical protein